MLIVADLPPITQQYLPKEKFAIEQVSENSSFHILTMGNSEYFDIPDLNPYRFHANLKKAQIIEKRISDMTFFGNLDIENYENTLTPSEVNSIGLLRGSYKREVNRLKNKANASIEFSDFIFSYVSKRLYRLPFQNSAVEINSDESMKFTLTFPNERLLMITKGNDYENLGIAKDQVIYSFFINRKLIASDVANLEVFIKNFKAYLSL